MGTLFLIGTPIGNLKDITARAKETLGVVDFLACEDTRRTGLLLKKLEIGKEKENKPRLISFFEENEKKRIPQIISFLKEGSTVGLVSSAGMPTVSDPGFKLVRECFRQGIKVKTAPGPSAVTTALISSGLPTDKFLFLGFLPKKKGKRRKIFRNLKSVGQSLNPTIVFFESPFRLLSSLKEIKKILGEVETTVARELTKIHEEVRKGKISEIIKHYSKKKPRGEITVVFKMNKDSFGKTT